MGARAGEGPSLIECQTCRWLGRYVGDPAAYRPKEEYVGWKVRDPVPRFEARLEAEGVLTAEEIERVRAEVRRELQAAVEFARQSPSPRPEDALEDLYA